MVETSGKNELETDSTETISNNKISNSKLTPALIEEPYENNKLVAQLYTSDQTTENWLSTFKVRIFFIFYYIYIFNESFECSNTLQLLMCEYEDSY